MDRLDVINLLFIVFLLLGFLAMSGPLNTQRADMFFICSLICWVGSKVIGEIRERKR